MKLILVTLLALVASIQAKATPTDTTTTTEDIRTAARAAPKDCTWDTASLGKLHPLYVKTKETSSASLELNINGFWLPQSGNQVTVPHGTEVIFSCPGTKLLGWDGESHTPQGIIPEVILKCIGGSKWKYKDIEQEFTKLVCKDLPEITIKNMGDNTCSVKIPRTQLLKIGFMVEKNFYTIIETCFNYRTKNSIYSRNLLTHAARAKYKKIEHKKNWPNDVDYYKPYKMNEIYDCATGYSKTFEHILGSKKQVKKYVDCERGREQLSRGHLTANADLPYYPIRMTTFKYMNAAPQWATVNSANWNVLETRTRELVESYTNGLLVYTGTHGVTTLPADNDNGVKDLYLYYNSGQGNGENNGNDNEDGRNGNNGGDNGNNGGGNGNEGGGNEDGGNGNEGGGNEGGGNGNEGGGNGNEGGGNEGGGNGNEGGGNGNEGGGNGNEGGGNGNEGGGNEGGGNGNEGGGDSDTCDVKMDGCNIEYKIRVPEFYWRVVYDPETKKGTAIVVINNPYLEKSKDPLCPDVCDQIKWLIAGKFKPDVQKLGYMYCCEVGELSKIVKEIPELEVDGLLI